MQSCIRTEGGGNHTPTVMFEQDELTRGRADCNGFKLGVCDSYVLTVGLADSSNEGTGDRVGNSVGCVAKLGL